MNTKLLRAVDGLDLPDEYRYRGLLRPGEAETDFLGNVHHLPRFFYEIRSWQEAHEVRLAPHFKLAELILVDCREAGPLLTQFPHYVPCAIVLLARFLEDFRREVDAPVFVSANGGYRSPAHQIGGAKSIHAWGTAANVYRVGDRISQQNGAVAFSATAHLSKHRRVLSSAWKRSLIFWSMDADGVRKRCLAIPAVWCEGE